MNRVDVYKRQGIGIALMQGIKRGLFSNEAGMGSAPNVVASADVTHPVKQGLIQTLESLPIHLSYVPALLSSFFSAEGPPLKKSME